MADDGVDEGRIIRFSTKLFRQIEHGVYIAIGALLSAGAVLALGGAAAMLWKGLGDWSGTQTILVIIDRLLFVLLLIEILHTIRASIRTGGLTCEPFLIVGLIASIRRVLVITLQTSEAMKPGSQSADSEMVFYHSMIELGVLAGLILILVISLYLIGRTTQSNPEG